MNNASSPNRGPVTNLPYELLCAIFTRCVQYSSAHALLQPNTKIAPMLLCQVCATWRAVVLSAPFLWSHLRFELQIHWHRNGRPFIWDPDVFERRLDWLRWWRQNLGSTAPYLQAEVRPSDYAQTGRIYCRGRLSESTCDFLLEFMSSAQYISVGCLYWYLVCRRVEAGYVVGIHPNAHTVVAASYVSEWGDYRLVDCNHYLTSALTETQSTLRHLVIEDPRLGPRDCMNPLHNWSSLTHLSLRYLFFLDLEVWYPFIRSLSSLQWGSFSSASWMRTWQPSFALPYAPCPASQCSA